MWRSDLIMFGIAGVIGLGLRDVVSPLSRHKDGPKLLKELKMNFKFNIECLLFLVRKPRNLQFYNFPLSIVQLKKNKYPFTIIPCYFFFFISSS